MIPWLTFTTFVPNYTDAIGPEFVEADFPDEFVRAFAQTQLAYYQYQDYLERAWVSGQKKEECGMRVGRDDHLAEGIVRV